MKINKEIIRQCALDADFEVCGFATVHEINDEAKARYSDWIDKGKSESMPYMEKYADVRNNPALLLEGAKTIIAVALNYYPSTFQDREVPQFAYYAYGKDYHDVVRNRLRPVAQFLADNYNATSRICVDTAPLRERYWAQQAGIGFVGINNQLILPDKGSYFFLGFLITTIEIEPDEPCTLSCMNCRRCIAYCPTKAISDNGAVDARKCLSCLTIEYRGEELPEGLYMGNRVYGCDTCQKCCPHNRNAQPTKIEEFMPSPEFLALDYDAIDNMTIEQYREIFRGSAVKRVKLPQLKRNLHYLK